MEIYKYIWQYYTRSELKDLLFLGYISESIFYELTNSIKSYVSNEQFLLEHKLGEYYRQPSISGFNYNPHKTIKKKDILLAGGVYYNMREKMVIAIKEEKTSCVIKEGIETIEYPYECYMDLGDFMNILGDYNIHTHWNLHKIKFPESLKKIGRESFYRTKLQCVDLPDNVEELGEMAFARNNSLKEIKLSKKLHTIGKGCFKWCEKIENIEFPPSLKSIKENAFEECVKLRYVRWPKDIEKIENQCFRKCSSLEEFTFSEGIKYIGAGAFSCCSSLKTIDFPHTIEHIDCEAFYNCTSLQTIIIPQNIKEIGLGAFSNCASLKRVEFHGQMQELRKSVFSECHSLEEIVMPNGLIEIGGYTFNACKSLKTIVIPNTVELIGNDAFRECELLLEIKFPDNLQVILSRAFKGCKNLRVVYVNSNIVKIFSQVFADCDSLQAIVIPTGTLKKMRRIFPKSVIDKLVEENQFQHETITPFVPIIEAPPKEYIIENVNRSFLKKFPWTYTKEVVLLSPCDTVGTCPKHLIYKRRDLLSYETKYQDYYYKIQNDFIQGKFYNLQDEDYITYAFILFFDLIESYKNNKNLENLLNQLEIMCLCCPKISKYIPEKLNSVINYKRLDDTQILKILDVFPDFKKEMFVPDYARLILRYTDSKLDKLKVMDCIPIKRITLSNSNAKRYKVSQEEIIKEVIDLVIEVIGKYDDFRKSCYNAIKGDGFWSLSDMYWIILRRCYAEVLNKHKITKVEPLDDRDYGIDNLNEYIEEILYTN